MPQALLFGLCQHFVRDRLEVHLTICVGARLLSELIGKLEELFDIIEQRQLFTCNSPVLYELQDQLQVRATALKVPVGTCEVLRLKAGGQGIALRISQRLAWAQNPVKQFAKG